MGIRHILFRRLSTGPPNASELSMEPHLSLLTFSPSPVIRPLRERRDDQKSGSLDLSMEVSIRADARRLFHALTAPEYVELWLSIPGYHLDCWTVGTKNDHEFAIEH